MRLCFTHIIFNCGSTSKYIYIYIQLLPINPTNTKIYCRTLDKVQKKVISNQRSQEILEKNLEKKKDLDKWGSILELPFEVKYICKGTSNILR